MAIHVIKPGRHLFSSRYNNEENSCQMYFSARCLCGRNPVRRCSSYGRQSVICSVKASSDGKTSPPNSEYPSTAFPAFFSRILRDCSVNNSAWLSGKGMVVRSACLGTSSSHVGLFLLQTSLFPLNSTRLSSNVSNRVSPIAEMRPSFPSHPAPTEGNPFPLGFDDVSSKPLTYKSHRAASA